MDDAEILAILDGADRSLDEGGSLDGTGFWEAVAAVKRSPTLVERFGPRLAEIDQRAFAPWPMLTVPIGPGTAIAAGVTAAGLGGVAASYYLDDPWNWIIFGASTIALLGSTHGLAHLVVGRAMGMRFTKWFVAGPRQPQPGVKIDYLSYLRTPARRRAWMHAAGALVTKVVPFALIPAAVAADLPVWVGWGLAALGLAALSTDIFWSTKASDWKKFARERRYSKDRA